MISKSRQLLAVEAEQQHPGLARQLAACDLQGVTRAGGRPCHHRSASPWARRAHVTTLFLQPGRPGQPVWWCKGLGPYTRHCLHQPWYPAPEGRGSGHQGLPAAPRPRRRRRPPIWAWRVFLNTRTLLDALRKAAPTSAEQALLCRLGTPWARFATAPCICASTPPRSYSSYVGLTAD